VNKKMFKHLTTKEHYETYQRMAEISGISYKNADIILGYTKDGMIEKYKEDRHLNNISLNRWDMLGLGTTIYFDRPISLSDRVCLVKHCTIYQFIGAIPEFTTGPYKYMQFPIIEND